MSLSDDLQKQNPFRHMDSNKECKSSNSKNHDDFRINWFNFEKLLDEMMEVLLCLSGQFNVSSSQLLRIKEFSKRKEQIFQSVKSSPASESAFLHDPVIAKLQTELDVCKKDLKNDEEIFVEKNKQIESKGEELKKMKTKLEEIAEIKDDYFDRIQNQDDQLISQQIALEDLTARLKEYEIQNDDNELFSDEEITIQNNIQENNTRMRAKSVPANMLGTRSEKVKDSSTRNINTSPAIISLERIMANFRARSQMMINRIEDDDEVNQSIIFNDESEIPSPSKLESPDNKQNSKFTRNSAARGTYRVNKTNYDKAKKHAGKSENIVNKNAHNILKIDPQNTEKSLNEKRLKKTETAVRQSTKKIHDLSFNIKMKEQLIKEMADKHNQTQQRNIQFEHKIEILEKDKKGLENEIQSLQKSMKEIENKDKAEKEVLQCEFRKKMEVAMKKLQSANHKQHETEKISTLAGGSKIKVQEQEVEIEKMKNQLKSLHKKLKEEGDHKTILVKEVEKEKNRISHLQTMNEQQRKVLKVKTEEAAAARKRYRNSSNGFSKDDMSNLENKQKMLDLEIEKALEHRKQLETLQEELENREEDLATREKLIEEKTRLEMKILRSSKCNPLENRNFSISENKENIVEEYDLTNEIDKLKKERKTVHKKREDGISLNKNEEQRLIEIDELIGAVDVALVHRNESVKCLRNSVSNFVRNSVVSDQHSNNDLLLLKALDLQDCKALLSHYIQKVIELKSCDGDYQEELDKLHTENEEQHQLIDNLEISLEETKTELERKLIKQQADHDLKIHELIEQYDQNTTSENTIQELKLKIKSLEKDLYYYKIKSRELKRSIMESEGSNNNNKPAAFENEKDSNKMHNLSGMNPDKYEISYSQRSPSISVSSPREVKSMSINNNANSKNVNNSLSENSCHELKVPLKLSRKELRKMSHDGLALRISQSSNLNLTDSLDDTK